MASVGMVVWGGIQVVVLALVPVAISGFPVADHALWMSSSLIFLAFFWILGEVVERIFPERMAMRAAWPMKARWQMELIFGILVILPMNLALIVILLGVLPDLEAALYFVALVLLLFTDTLLLLFMVTSGGRPRHA